MKRSILFFLTLFITHLAISQWTQLKNAPFINHHSNGFGANGKAYIVQGEPQILNGQNGNMMWEYTPETDSWEALGLTPARATTLAIGDDMNGKYYFGFGDNSDVWEFDPATKQYKQLPSCPCERRGHPAFVAHNNKIFVGAGSGDYSDLTDWWVFNFDTNTWEQKEDIPGERRHHPYQFGIDNAIYVGGGHEENWLRWDINEETWSAIDDFPGGRVAGTQFSYQDYGFVLSGDAIDHAALEEKSFLMYAPETDQWYDLPFEKTMHRWACSSFIIDNFLYYFGGIGYVDGGDDSNMWKFDFNSISCLAPSRIFATELTESSVNLFWSESLTGEIDHFQYRAEGDKWITVETTGSLYFLDGLTPCTNYEYRIHVDCEVDGEVYSDSESFRTKGCGTCIDETYCEADSYWTGNGHISTVSINGYTNNSGDNDGYAQFTNSSDTELVIGEDFDFSTNLSTTSSVNEYNLKVYLYINHDGEFTDEGLLIDEKNLVGTFQTLAKIPVTAESGLSRLRVILQVYNDIPGPCGSNDFLDGEVEDYCVTLVNELTSTDESDNYSEHSMQIFPNPFNNYFKIKYDHLAECQQLNIENIQGKTIFTQDLSNNRVNEMTIKDLDLSKGLYIVRLIDKSGQKSASKKLVKF